MNKKETSPGYLKLIEDSSINLSEEEINQRINDFWNEIEPVDRNIYIWTSKEGMKLFDKMIKEEYET